ncbi:hypothetical protein GCM10012275_37690 [Longimycelium tulufanense]|uniref:Phosphatidic acid phosphatase type 2/haloperoxidase domain-containing protein n=1 Tax=Longimycelium tulufanense TaxID=907463 RepID=A0A8J3CA17_9PSEU|nr:phosphatase PAP2 family protein [Longimycelium tulufanense]GGM63548.1 hypothetical protein GCM10012275_37690 [Longimycelium tulufanense]
MAGQLFTADDDSNREGSQVGLRHDGQRGVGSAAAERGQFAASSHRSRTPGLVGFLVTAVACVIAFIACYVVLVLTPGGQQVEDALFLKAWDPAVAKIMSPLSRFRIAADLVFPLAALATVWLVAVARRCRRLGRIGIGCIAASVGVAEVLKYVVLDRPALNGLSLTGGNSFPSGHVAFAMSFVLALVLVLPHRARPHVMAVGGTGVAVTAGMTVMAGWHRPSDIIGSTLLVLAVFCVAILLLARGGGVSVQPDQRSMQAMVAALMPMSFVLALWFTVGGTPAFAGTVTTAFLMVALRLLHSVDLSSQLHIVDRDLSHPTRQSVHNGHRCQRDDHVDD